MLDYQAPLPYHQVDALNEACYNAHASYWERFPFPDALPHMIATYYNPQLGNKVLDVGSGTGVLAQWLSERGFDVLCLDPSSEMIRRCQEKHLRTLQCSIQNYHAQDRFALVFAILSLIHVPKSQFSAQLEKLSVTLPSGGFLFLGMLGGKEEHIDQNPSPRFFAYYTIEELKEKTASHFTLEKCHQTHLHGKEYLLLALKKK